MIAMTTYPATPERLVTRAEIERLRAACRCALAALTQPATYPADIALAARVLREAIGEDVEMGLDSAVAIHEMSGCADGT